MVKQESPGAIVYNPEQVQLIKDVYAKGASNNELALFVEVAQRKGLDIFSRQIHLVKRYDSQLQKEVMEPQTGIDGYRLMAERTGKYEGQLGPFWCGADGEWKDVWLSSDPPAAAKVGTLKAGCREPFWAVALYKEYVQTRKDGQPNAMWKKMAANQLAKCAEALSLRKAFPGDLAGIYTQEEMAQASNGMIADVAPEDDGIDAEIKETFFAAGKTEAEWLEYERKQVTGKPSAYKRQLLERMRARLAAKAEPAPEPEGEVVEAKPLGPDHGKVIDLTEALKEAGQTYDAINAKIAALCGGIYAVEELDDAQAAKAANALTKWFEELKQKGGKK
jgi:phage recombination protein Bet